MKRVVVVHCWEGYPDYCWYQSVKKDLERYEFQVEVPGMPDTKHPKMYQWLEKLSSVIGEPNKETFLVGHSLGAVAILRYLEGLRDDQKVGGVVLVAGFTDDLGFKELSNFFQTPIDLEKVKTKSDHFVAIHSDDDPYVDIKYGHEFEDKLGAKLVIRYKMGHFSGHVDDEDSCTSLIDVTQAVTDMVVK